MKLIKKILIPLLLSVALITCSGGDDGGGDGGGGTTSGGNGGTTGEEEAPSYTVQATLTRNFDIDKEWKLKLKLAYGERFGSWCSSMCYPTKENIEIIFPTGEKTINYNFAAKVKIKKDYGHDLAVEVVDPKSASECENKRQTVDGSKKIEHILCAKKYYSLKVNVNGLLKGENIQLYNKTSAKSVTVEGEDDTGSMVTKSFYGIAQGEGYDIAMTDNLNNNRKCFIVNPKDDMQTGYTSVEVICSAKDKHIISGKIAGIVREDEEWSLTLNNKNKKTFKSTYGETEHERWFWWIAENGPYEIKTVLESTLYQNRRECNIVNGSGTIQNKDIANVEVICKDKEYSHPVTLTGLCPGEGQSVTLTNSADGSKLTLQNTGTFHLHPLSVFDAHDVSIVTSDNRMICKVINGRGFPSSAEVKIICNSCACSNGTKSVTVRWNPSRAALVNESGGGHKVYWRATSSFNEPTDSGVREMDVPFTQGNSAVIPNLYVGCTYKVRVRPYSKLNPAPYNKDTNPLGSRLSDEQSIAIQ